MAFLNHTYIRRYELGLLFQRGDFVQVLHPGKHPLPGLFGGFRQLKIEVVKTLDVLFKHKLLDVLLEDAHLRQLLHVVDLADTQRAFVWRDGRLIYALGPGRHALWRDPYPLEIEVLDVGDFAVTHEKLDVLLKHTASAQYIEVVEPKAHTEALIFREGELVERVQKGRFAYWKGPTKVHWHEVDLREQTIDVAGQEIMTRDKVTLRMNLVLTYKVVDPVLAVTAVSDYAQALYRDAQLALRAAVGTRGLDALLANKESTGQEVADALMERARGFGVAVTNVGIRDIVLPGDMKTILNQVIEAQKQAEANLVRRREETAAARSQANTAKLLAENPILARFKELELLQEVLAGAKTTFVFGNGDIRSQLDTLIGRGEQNEKAE